MKYVALLRGVNVGGKNKLPMGELKAAIEKLGMTDVQTYINSGNIIFSTDEEDDMKLQETIKDMIKRKFDITTPVAVISENELKESMANAPDWWNVDKEDKNNAIFVIPPATAESIIEIVGEAKPEYEKIGYSGRIIFWTAPLKTFSRTRWSKVVSTSAYNDITIRNANTANKLLSLIEN